MLTCPQRLQKFQFHKGPIKTIVLLVFIGLGCEFQFHKGPIKTWRGL